MSVPPVVIKVGGSLLGQPRAAEKIGAALERVAEERPKAHRVLIVGGGGPVEWLWRLDREQPLGEAAAHWAAIAMMDANTTAVAGWIPAAEVIDDWRGLQARIGQDGVTLFAPGRFLRDEEPTLAGRKLPVGWQVTSDSIAARIAIALDAPLTLLKSRAFGQPESMEGWRRLAEAGAVDKFFPELVGQLAAVELSLPR